MSRLKKDKDLWSSLPLLEAGWCWRMTKTLSENGNYNDPHSLHAFQIRCRTMMRHCGPVHRPSQLPDVAAACEAILTCNNDPNTHRHHHKNKETDNEIRNWCGTHDARDRKRVDALVTKCTTRERAELDALTTTCLAASDMTDTISAALVRNLVVPYAFELGWQIVFATF